MFLVVRQAACSSSTSLPGVIMAIITKINSEPRKQGRLSRTTFLLFKERKTKRKKSRGSQASDKHKLDFNNNYTFP